jgi:formate-dependent nitrite reductase membrane component NrfD
MTFAAASSSMRKGESLRDTVQTISAMGVDALVVRHGAAGAGMTLPLAISPIVHHLPRRMRRPASLFSAALTLAGGFAVRYAVVMGGRQSAGDPQATFDMTG